MAFLQRVRRDIQTDENLIRAADYSKRAISALPRASLDYTVEKLPFLQWIPRYRPKWLINDLLAGIIVGILLIPQGLAYAAIAGIPVEIGLFSSWLPAAIYIFMGTSKDLSAGPTSILGILTSSIITNLQPQGFEPQAIASGVAFMVGVYALLTGFLRLGFLLDFISAPVITGFISGAATLIILSQVDSLLGLDFPNDTVQITHAIFTMLGSAKWRDALVGFSGIILLEGLQYAGKKWGSRYRVVWALSAGRAAVAIFLYAGISYGVNKNRMSPLFEISPVNAKGLAIPAMPMFSVVKQIPVSALAPFVAASLEHIAIGRSFGVRNGYAIDQSQELTFLGVANFVNGYFGAMPVSGAISRTAVNSSAGVRSPLSGLFVSGIVLLGIYKLGPALSWIPRATLAAIIVTAVYTLIGPLSLFYKFWRTSLADFIASMICFWVTLFVSAEHGIAFAVLFSIGYNLIRSAFSTATVVESCEERGSWRDGLSGPADVPADTKVFRFSESLFFPNANRTKDHIMTHLQVYHSNAASNPKQPKDRNWSVAQEIRIRSLRLQRQIASDDDLPLIRVAVLDFTRVANIDVTALRALHDLRADIARFGGGKIEIRFVGFAENLRNRFNRSDGWKFIEVDHPSKAWAEQDCIGIYPSLSAAIFSRRCSSDNPTAFDNEDKA